MPKILSKIDNKDGFSLIEVVLAMVIFLTIMMGFSVLTIGVLKSSKKTKMITEGNNLVIDKLEYIQSCPYDHAAAGGCPEMAEGTHTEDYGAISGYSGFKRVVVVSLRATSSLGPPRVLGQKRITVTVYWNQDSQQNNATLYVTE